MSERSPRVYIEDIQACIEKIERYVEDMDYSQFQTSEMVIDAVLRNIEIIGEAARQLPDEVRERYDEVPWSRIIGLRNIVTHGYFGVDMENIWKIVKDNLTELKPHIERMLAEL
jgi:uncharacterized protein with HEPN domain